MYPARSAAGLEIEGKGGRDTIPSLVHIEDYGIEECFAIYTSMKAEHGGGALNLKHFAWPDGRTTPKRVTWFLNLHAHGCDKQELTANIYLTLVIMSCYPPSHISFPLLCSWLLFEARSRASYTPFTLPFDY